MRPPRAPRAIAREVKRWAGYRRHRWVPECETVVVMVDAEEQGIEGRWALICDAHSSIVSFDTQADALGFIDAPGDWCERCMGG